MNCTCVKDIQKKIIGREFGDKKKTIIEAKIIDIAFIFGDGNVTMTTNSRIELVVDGYKKSQYQSMLHSYCPFCGTKIKKDNEQ